MRQTNFVKSLALTLIIIKCNYEAKINFLKSLALTLII